MHFPISMRDGLKTIERLNISVEEISSDTIYVSFTIDDKELLEKIFENINRNISFGICENCSKIYIVNSTTHRICWRCRKKDKEQGSGNIEI